MNSSNCFYITETRAIVKHALQPLPKKNIAAGNKVSNYLQQELVKHMYIYIYILKGQQVKIY